MQDYKNMCRQIHFPTRIHSLKKNSLETCVVRLIFQDIVPGHINQRITKINTVIFIGSQEIYDALFTTKTTSTVLLVWLCLGFFFLYVNQILLSGKNYEWKIDHVAGSQTNQRKQSCHLNSFILWVVISTCSSCLGGQLQCDFTIV